MATIQGVCESALPYNVPNVINPTTGLPVGGCRYADVSGFPPCKLYFVGAPASGTVSAIYSNGSAPCAGTLYAANGTRLAVISSSERTLKTISYSGGAPYFVAQTGSSIFITFA